MFLRTAALVVVLTGVIAWTAGTHSAEEVPIPPQIPSAPPPMAKKLPNPPPQVPKHFHNNAVQAFGQTPGFGPRRMIPTMKSIEPIQVTWSPGDLSVETLPVEVPALAKIHKDRAGLLSRDAKLKLPAPGTMTSLHADGPDQHWQLKSIDLIGLVDRDDPVVYITAKLPSPELARSMSKLAKQALPQHGQTMHEKSTSFRTPDVLELAALEQLQRGEEMFVRSKDSTLRMVGALRASKACLECHVGKEGDLFGAFSYTLTKVGH